MARLVGGIQRPLLSGERVVSGASWPGLRAIPRLNHGAAPVGPSTLESRLRPNVPGTTPCVHCVRAQTFTPVETSPLRHDASNCAPPNTRLSCDQLSFAAFTIDSFLPAGVAKPWSTFMQICAYLRIMSYGAPHSAKIPWRIGLLDRQFVQLLDVLPLPPQKQRKRHLQRSHHNHQLPA